MQWCDAPHPLFTRNGIYFRRALPRNDIFRHVPRYRTTTSSGSALPSRRRRRRRIAPLHCTSPREPRLAEARYFLANMSSSSGGGSAVLPDVGEASTGPGEASEVQGVPKKRSRFFNDISRQTSTTFQAGLRQASPSVTAMSSEQLIVDGDGEDEGGRYCGLIAQVFYVVAYYVVGAAVYVNLEERERDDQPTARSVSGVNMTVGDFVCEDCILLEDVETCMTS
mmetsp:Transcript_35686/g.112138  ORF Transcript_35686/g.112138 Transcript_35686/m.112138 type:complete len:224 (+) Transcript_35686:2-673(+)